MKAATGELNLTVITLIAIAAVIGFFWFMWEPIKTTIQEQFGTITDKDESQKSAGENPFAAPYIIVER